MHSLERLGFKRQGTTAFEMNYLTGQTEKKVVSEIKSRAKSQKTRELRSLGFDVRYTKVRPGYWAVWTKPVPSSDLKRIEPRLQQAVKYKESRKRGNVSIPSYGIKMKKIHYKKRSPKYVPVDPQVQRLMRKEKAYVDSTGRRIVLPMQKTTFERRHKARKARTVKNHPMKYVWPFRLMPRKRG